VTSYLKSDYDIGWQERGKCAGVNVLLPKEVAELEKQYGRELTEEELRIEQIRKTNSIFFPARGESTVTAKAFCASCPVQMPCLQYSLVNGIKHGVWGGTPYRTRRRTLRIRKMIRDGREAGIEPDI
jgi:hypothetical protein